MLSNFGIKFLIILILVDILEPPIIHVIGFLISDVIFLKHQFLNLIETCIRWKKFCNFKN